MVGNLVWLSEVRQSLRLRVVQIFLVTLESKPTSRLHSGWLESYLPSLRLIPPSLSLLRIFGEKEVKLPTLFGISAMRDEY